MTEFFLEYDLPAELIAQAPLARRDDARLMIVDKSADSIHHAVVRDLPDALDSGDRLVFNDSRVLPARLVGRRTDTGGRWEGLFLAATSEGLWRIIGQTRGRLREGFRIAIDPGPFQLELLTRLDGGEWLARPSNPGPVSALLARHGHVPIPPYIRKGKADLADSERYQTVYARHDGSVAAPTAGLHFTPELLERLRQKDIGRSWVTLHVGLGTFRPMASDDIERHKMHAERAELPQDTVAAIEETKRQSKRIVAVGTTTTRVLEGVARTGALRAWSGELDLFIHPPYEFRVVQALLTNFHLPRSTLLLLVGAFAGSDLLRRAYQIAIAERYRFYSYGDAMLIL